MNELSLLYNYLLVGAILFVLGLVGFITRRNMIVMFLCAEMMLQGVSLTLISFGRYHGSQLVDPAKLTPATMGAYGGQMLVIFIITVAACEAGIAMALILMLAQRAGNLDAAVWQDLREEGQPAYVDSRVPEERNEDHVWPTLTTAGREPQHDLEESTHRSKV
ncbi:MAG: NADH-quinone oxidoreductase subunit NuoK [Pirellulaceae bacterium]